MTAIHHHVACAHSKAVRLTGLAAVCINWICHSAIAMDDPPPSRLRQVQKISLLHVSGRIDHMTIDHDGGRLYIAAIGDGTVQVVDLNAEKVIGRIANLPEPQGIAYLSSNKQIIVSCGGDGTCRLFDAATLTQLASVNAGDDADNIRIDPHTGLIYVGFDPGLAILQAGKNSLTRIAEIKLAGHAESFQLESSGPRIFVNVPQSQCVQVVDREKKSVISRWDIGDARSNFPMALDESAHRLFVICRRPAKLVDLDSESGQLRAMADCVGDADDLFVNEDAQLVYVSGGEGFIDVFTPGDSAHELKRIERIATTPGARTSLFDAKNKRLYLAVPQEGDRSAEIRVFEVSAGG